MCKIYSQWKDGRWMVDYLWGIDFGFEIESLEDRWWAILNKMNFGFQIESLDLGRSWAIVCSNIHHCTLTNAFSNRAASVSGGNLIFSSFSLANLFAT